MTTPPPPPSPPPPADRPTGLAPPPPAGAPSPPAFPTAPDRPTAGSGPPVAGRPLLVAMTIVVSVGVTFLLWWISEDVLAQAGPGSRGIWIPAAALATAGATWALGIGGSGRSRRALVAAVVGAVVGAAGGLLLGSEGLRADAVTDALLSAPSLARAAGWALYTAFAWAVTMAVASPAGSRQGIATGAAIGGAIVGATMGLLTGTFLFGDDVVPTDLWWPIPLDVSGAGARALLVLALGVAVPVVLARVAQTGGRTALAIAVIVGLLLPIGAAAAGYGTDVDAARRDGADPFDVPGQDALDEASPVPSVGPFGPATSAPPGEGGPGTGTGSSDDETVAAPAAPAAPATSTAATPPPDAQPAAPAAPAGPATVPVDIDPGFPVVIDWRITATNDLGQVAVSRLAIGPVYATGAAPAAPDGGVTCAAGPGDAVIPFFMSVSPSTIGVGTVTIAFSQGAPGIADTARFPMTVEFNEVGGHRCTSATSSDPVTTPAQAVFTNIADGEVGGGYGYLVVPAYFDAAGMPLGATSAVLVVTPSINGRATDNVFTVYGVVPVEYVDPVSGRTFGAVPLAP